MLSIKLCAQALQDVLWHPKLLVFLCWPISLIIATAGLFLHRASAHTDPFGLGYNPANVGVFWLLLLFITSLIIYLSIALAITWHRIILQADTYPSIPRALEKQPRLAYLRRAAPLGIVAVAVSMAVYLVATLVFHTPFLLTKYLPFILWFWLHEHGSNTLIQIIWMTLALGLPVIATNGVDQWQKSAKNGVKNAGVISMSTLIVLIPTQFVDWQISRFCREDFACNSAQLYGATIITTLWSGTSALLLVALLTRLHQQFNT